MTKEKENAAIISQEEIDASQKLADEMGIPLKVRIYSYD